MQLSAYYWNMHAIIAQLMREDGLLNDILVVIIELHLHFTTDKHKRLCRVLMPLDRNNCSWLHGIKKPLHLSI